MLNSFQLAKGYSRAIMRFPSILVPQEIFDTHIKVTASRALHKALPSKTSTTHTQNMLHQELVYMSFTRAPVMPNLSSIFQMKINKSLRI